MTYYAELNQVKIKKFPAKTLESAYRQYNNYCKSKIPHCQITRDEKSIGLHSWGDGEKCIRLVKE